MDMDHLFPSTTAGPTPSSPPELPLQCSGLVSAARGLAGTVLCAVATCVFAAVGSLVGAVTGSMIGLATESGVLRGAGIGVISGAVFAIEVAESSRDLGHYSGDSAGVWSVIHMVEIVGSLLSGRLVREKAGPVVRSAVQSQISAIGSPLFAETSDLFETGGSAKGLPADALSRLPEVEITEDDAADARGCAVCLQDFRAGETARRLPGCRHVFHVPCIDCWLVRHGSCPLCRRDI